MKRRIALGVFLIAALSAPIAPALAGKGPSNGGSSISLVQISAATASTATGPSFGDAVTFAVSTNRTGTPFVYLNCYQSGTLVYAESHPMYQPNSANDPGTFSLGPSAAWAGGAADCSAMLVGFNHNGNDQILASTTFHVGA